MGRFKSFNENGRKSYFIFGTIMLILFLVMIALFIEIPQYFPNYAYINHIYSKNLRFEIIPSGRGINVANISINDYNNTVIAFIKNSTTVNITIVNNSGIIIANEREYLGVRLSEGNYSIFLINTANTTSYVIFDYGLFNYNFISSFYSSLGLIKGIYEIIMAGSLVIGAYAIIKGIFRK
ncbi:hypothetical protein [Saccharolobus caldissimus]|uniref:Uncharacterized protein n=1 Tax=Saccharolobus caldissimus TaxID=1702097 RepID=A0AAQ4CMK7_9CREN|nr:hypothetical protein [Saccharolobus caldissimus]BDB97038.1 hypothetical protein SACC_00550 [Saccharolobus caldissimus]